MARDSRLRRDMLVDIDTGALWKIAEAAGATHKQYRNSYSRALKRTAVTLRKQALADLKTVWRHGVWQWCVSVCSLFVFLVARCLMRPSSGLG